MSFGKNLRALREERGIERKILAQNFDMPYNTLKNYENDEREPGHSFIIKVAKFFGVTADFLLDNDMSNLTDHSLAIKENDKCIANEALEVADAYQRADFKHKNIVRETLDLPRLTEPASDTARKHEDTAD